ncbi:ATP-binding protein [Gordonia amicalis]|uniref:AAA family ATPase n=1 Tax=Gordonia amicalis TaxID=89053 RepID=UPI0029548911|nr:ATP-binding protein [Gordonia amicalis]MDV7102068.1 ATP-binding protein [Gordonia amicalis]
MSAFDISQPKLLVFFVGYPGAGKTQLANRLSEEMGSVLLSADAARLRVFGSNERVDDALRESEIEAYDHLYGALFYCTEQILRSGRSVILDGQFSRKSDRKILTHIAVEFNALPVLIHLQTPRRICDQRLLTRRRGADSRRFTRAQIAAVFDHFHARLEQPTAGELVLSMSGQIDSDKQLEMFFEYVDIQSRNRTGGSSYAA